MATRTPGRRPVAGAPGFKALVTALSLAVTLGGWAVIASNAPKVNPQVDNTLPPMPTLVPTPEPYVAQAVTRQNLRANSNAAGSANSAPGASVPTAQAPSVRSVTINPNLLPRAQAITRSSR